MISLIPLLHLCIMMANLGLIIACLIQGSKLRRLCNVALWFNAVLLVGLVALSSVVFFQVTGSEQKAIALLAGSVGAAPTLLAILAFAAIKRWRMRSPIAPPPVI
jgi:hypothetical protein